MKKLFILLLIAISFVFFSCKKETTGSSIQNNSQTSSPEKIMNPAANVFATCSNWTVAVFMKNGVDQAANFANSSLVFCPDYSFTISNDIMSDNGKWFFGTSGNTSTDNPLYLHIDFSSSTTNETWKDLGDIWKVNTLQQGNIELQTMDGTKMLTLQKLIR